MANKYHVNILILSGQEVTATSNGLFLNGDVIQGGNLNGLISTGDSDLRYLRTGVSGEFYKASNPAGYITSANLNGLITTGAGDLRYLQTGASGSFYLASNPSSFITSANLNGLANTGYVNIVSGSINERINNLPTYNLNGLISTGSADTRYYAIGNPNNFSTSGNVQNTGTALQNQLGNYYLKTNPNNFSSSGNVQNTGAALVGLINNLKPFSRGGTMFHSTGISTGNYIVWRSQFPCTVTGVWGYRVGGTNASFNAGKNGSSNHLAVAALTASPDVWTNGGAVTNTSYAAGDKLEIMIVAVTGSITQFGVQVDFIKI